MTEPQPADPHGPRYSTRPFPPYRFVPGQTPHPRRHPHGHSYGQAEPNPALFPAEEWQKSDAYLYGIDLYNFAYWWECHEVFEGLWHAAGRETEQANGRGEVMRVRASFQRPLVVLPSHSNGRAFIRRGAGFIRHLTPDEQAAPYHRSQKTTLP